MLRRARVSLLTILALLVGASMLCAAQSQTLMTHHLRSVVQDGQAKLVGPVPGTQTMRLNVVLALRDPAGLEAFLRQVYDPNSAIYRHFLTVKDFTNMFGPTQKDYDAVVDFVRTNGFSVVGGSRDAMDVTITGSAATVETAFHVAMNFYKDPETGRTFYAPDREPTVNLPFQLWHISGLDNYSIPVPLVKHIPAGEISLATTGSCPQQSFCGSDMRAAYYGNGSLTGAGQNIGLLEYYGFDIQDVNTYYTNAGQNRTAAVTGISTDGTSINCVYPSCDDTEQTLDITQALGMAPGVTTAYVYVGSTDTALLGGMSSGTPLPLNLSSSWSWKPADPNTDDPYFMKMAAQGQTFFQAAGDSGKWVAGQFVYPNEDANVVCVGGTDLTTTGPGGGWNSESTWVDGGGGISPDHIAIPSWQQLPGVINSSNMGSTTYRNGPDVSANSNFTFYVCADQKSCTANLYGGTSFAAPMWAGYIALANEQAATYGDTPPGFINPTIYPLGLGSDYNKLFHDITTGSNGFPAVTGYDLATGWGSPNGDALINALAPAPQGTFTLSASPKGVMIQRGHAGTTTITSTIQGGFNAAVTLSTKLFFVSFNPNPIPAPGSGQSTMTIVVPANAPTGNHVITVTGTGGGTQATTQVYLKITQ